MAITWVLRNAHEYEYHYSNQRIKFVEMYFFCIYTAPGVDEDPGLRG